MPCLEVKVNVSSIRISPTISLFCDVKQLVFYPLLANGEYLFVEDNGIISFLCVDS